MQLRVLAKFEGKTRPYHEQYFGTGEGNSTPDVENDREPSRTGIRDLLASRVVSPTGHIKDLVPMN